MADTAAQVSADAATASSSAIAAQSWAVGETGTRADEDVNNAKFWAQQAQRMATGGSGKKSCRFVIGTTAAGWMEADCDYLCDGVDDHVEINAAIQALPETGGEILILDGTYALNSSIILDKPNTVLTGCGNATILKALYRTFSAPILHIMANGCTVRSLCLDGGYDLWTDTVSIRCKGAHCSVEHVDGINSYYYMILHPGSDYFRMADCSMLDDTYNAINLSGDYAAVTRCLMHYIKVGAADCVVSQNQINGLDEVEPVSCEGTRNTFVDNHIRAKTSSVVLTSSSAENLVTGNIISGAAEVSDSGTSNVAVNNIFTA